MPHPRIPSCFYLRTSICVEIFLHHEHRCVSGVGAPPLDIQLLPSTTMGSQSDTSQSETMFVTKTATRRQMWHISQISTRDIWPVNVWIVSVWSLRVWASTKRNEKYETELTGLAATVLKVTFIFHSSKCSHRHFNHFKHFVDSTGIGNIANW